jgi:hypothetical protein
MASKLHQFYAVMHKIPFFGAILGQICIIFGSNLASKLKKVMPELHFFGANKVQI